MYRRGCMHKEVQINETSFLKLEFGIITGHPIVKNEDLR